MKSSSPIVQVVLFKQVDKPLDYLIPEPFLGRLKPGMRVIVPVRKHQATGIVVKMLRTSTVSRLRPILDLLDEEAVIDEALLELTRQVSEYYLTGWGTALRAALPPGLSTSPLTLYRLTSVGKMAIDSKKRLPKLQHTLMNILSQSVSGTTRGLTSRALARQSGSPSPASTLQPLIKKGWVEQRNLVTQSKTPVQTSTTRLLKPSAQHLLPLFFSTGETTPLDQAILERRFQAFCAQGLTMESSMPFIIPVITQLLSQQRTLLVLTPEVNQANKIAADLAITFGIQVGLLHGDLSPALRTATWKELAWGRYPIVVGTRTAAFAPIKSAGLIVILQEEDPSYKAEESPHYHAREVVLMKARIEKIPVLLTSLTPSLETYANCQNHKYTLLKSNYPAQVPVNIEDMKLTKTGQILSGRLRESIKKCLRARQSVLLLLNRKGFSTALICKDCGHIFRCLRCGVALVFHREAHRLICHSCGAKQGPPTLCPNCKGAKIHGIGLGIEQVENCLHHDFPGAKVLRVDRNTPPARYKKADIYLGTEWIYRWAASPDTSLIGVLDADTTLYLPDYHASERTFHFIAQVMAYARTSKSGRGVQEVVIQTHYPEHAGISWAEKGDPDLFYTKELFERRGLNYPPFSRLVSITVASKNQSSAHSRAQKIAKQLRDDLSGEHEFQVLGPAPAPLTPLRGQHRYLLLIKGPTNSRLQEVLQRKGGLYKTRKDPGTVTVVVDPLRLR